MEQNLSLLHVFSIEALKTHGMQQYRLSHVATQQIAWLLLQDGMRPEWLQEVKHEKKNWWHLPASAQPSHNLDVFLVPTQQLFPTLGSKLEQGARN